MQPLYCSFTANGKKAHTPGTGQGGRVKDVSGWINSALGELAKIDVIAEDVQAKAQTWARMTITVPPDADVVWNAETRTLEVIRKK